MSGKTVFISYRRDATGKAFARSLKEALGHRGYDAFLDVDSMEAGPWPDQIRREVPVRDHFLLLLTPGALDACEAPGNWVRQEFELALATGRNIVPVREESVDLRDMALRCPASLRPAFTRQSADLRHGSFESDLNTLLNRFIAPHHAPKALEPGVTAPQVAPTPSPVKRPAPAPRPLQRESSPALAVWKRKLELLEVEQAKAVDAAAKFKIQEDILEAEAHIRRLQEPQ